MAAALVSNRAMSEVLHDPNMLTKVTSYLPIRDCALVFRVATIWNYLHFPTHIAIEDSVIDIDDMGRRFTDTQVARYAASNRFRRVCSLKLWDIKITNAAFKHFGNAPIRTLSLNLPNITAAVVEHLVPMPLTSLELHGYWVNNAVLQSLSNNPIHTLRLNGTSITDEGLPHLAKMPLRSFSLNKAGIRGAGFVSLAGMQLDALDLTETFVDTKDLTETIARMNNSHFEMRIRKLTLDVRGSTELLTHIQKMSLEYLSLRGCRLLYDSEMEPIRGFRLQYLDLSDNYIGDAGLQHLDGMPLRHLNLAGNAVTSAGLKILNGMPLENLSLENTGADNRILLVIKNLPLRNLNVDGTRVTDPGRDFLRIFFPKLLRVNFYDYANRCGV